MAAAAGGAAGGAGGAGGAAGGGKGIDINGNTLNIGGGGGGSNGGSGDQGNFIRDIANVEKDLWTKYINSTNLQQQAVLPTQAQPVVQQAQPTQPQQVVTQPQEPTPPTQPTDSQKSDVTEGFDPAFQEYKKSAIEADEQKKKKATTDTQPATPDANTIL